MPWRFPQEGSLDSGCRVARGSLENLRGEARVRVGFTKRCHNAGLFTATMGHNQPRIFNHFFFLISCFFHRIFVQLLHSSFKSRKMSSLRINSCVTDTNGFVYLRAPWFVCRVGAFKICTSHFYWVILTFYRRRGLTRNLSQNAASNRLPSRWKMATSSEWR